MINIVHVTPHLGGGVGKAISGLILADRDVKQFNHIVIALEALEKKQSVKKLLDAGVAVYENPEESQLNQLLQSADIVQIEFWNHPLIPKLLCSQYFPAARVVFWCHISGLATPCIPSGIFEFSHQVVFTSACTKNAVNIANLLKDIKNKISVISSGGGFESLPYPIKDNTQPLRFGYLGSMNFSKMHPDYIKFVSAIKNPSIQIKMAGDNINRSELEGELKKIGKEGLLEFLGYQSDVVKIFTDIDVFIYLLNPTHYGTAENALLEAMAMGVIPVVLENGAEKEIVINGETGFFINTPEELNEVIDNLSLNLELRKTISKNASNFVRNNFSYLKSAQKFEATYKKALLQEKQKFDYRCVFGSYPYEWFLAYQSNPMVFTKSGGVNLPSGPSKYAVFEETKGSVLHFLKYFPKDEMLINWANSVSLAKTGQGL